MPSFAGTKNQLNAFAVMSAVCSALLIAGCQTSSGTQTKPASTSQPGVAGGAQATPDAQAATQAPQRINPDTIFGVWKIETRGADPACKTNLLDDNAGVGDNGERVAITVKCPTAVAGITSYIINDQSVVLNAKVKSRVTTLAELTLDSDGELKGTLASGGNPIRLVRPEREPGFGPPPKNQNTSS